MAIVISQHLHIEDHYLIFQAADAARSSSEEKIILDGSLFLNQYDFLTMGLPNAPAPSLKENFYIPHNLEITGDCYINNNQNIYELPDDLTVHKMLIAAGCKNLKSLPKNLVVKRDLYINATGIPEDYNLPEDLQVSGRITKGKSTDYVDDYFLFNWFPTMKPINYIKLNYTVSFDNSPPVVINTDV